MKDLIIAVGGDDAGFTPPMPFIGQRWDGGKPAALARLMLEIALVRCGFDVSDRRTPLSDPQKLIFQSNRVGANGIVVMSSGAFGSRKSFNDVAGGTVKYSTSRHGAKARELAEDVCAKLNGVKQCITAICNHEWNGAACPAVVVEMGYLTNFDEAKLMHDPDYIHDIAEYATMGICEYFGMPYIPHSPAAYKQLRAHIGMRGKNIKLVQSALCAAGYAVDIDGVYGKNTDIAVKAFAINNGHTEDCDGISDSLLNDLLFVSPAYIPPISKHNNVLYVQRKLIAKLYNSPENGTADENTVSAANEFLTETENTHAIDKNGGITKEAIRILSAIGGGRPRLF